MAQTFRAGHRLRHFAGGDCRGAIERRVELLLMSMHTISAMFVSAFFCSAALLRGYPSEATFVTLFMCAMLAAWMK